MNILTILRFILGKQYNRIYYHRGFEREILMKFPRIPAKNFVTGVRPRDRSGNEVQFKLSCVVLFAERNASVPSENYSCVWSAFKIANSIHLYIFFYVKQTSENALKVSIGSLTCNEISALDGSGQIKMFPNSLENIEAD